MKPSILIINPPPWGVDMYPLAATCIHSYLKSKGHRSFFLDLNIDLYSYLKQEELWDLQSINHWYDPTSSEEIYTKSKNIIEQYISFINRQKPTYIAFSFSSLASTSFIKFFIQDIERSVSYAPLFICGGGITYSIPERHKLMNLFHDDIQYIIKGEGEIILDSLLRSQNKNLHLIPNLFININHLSSVQLDVTAVQSSEMFRYYILTQDVPKHAPDITRYPLLLPPKTLYSKGYKSAGHMPVFLSRGCISHCTYCNDTTKYFGMRTKNPKRLAKEIIKYHKKYKMNMFHFHDLLLNADPELLQKFCDCLRKKKKKIRLTGFFRIDKKMTPEYARKLKGAGFSHILIGVDNFSNKILRAMNKNYTYKDIYSTLKILSDEGVNYTINYIVGYPRETKDDFKEEIIRLKELSPFITTISSLNTLDVNPGSLIQKKPDRYGIVMIKDIDHNYNKWYTKNKDNTPEIRQKRLNEFRRVAKSYDIDIEYTNSDIKI